jgi:hypothetical protein
VFGVCVVIGVTCHRLQAKIKRIEDEEEDEEDRTRTASEADLGLDAVCDCCFARLMPQTKRKKSEIWDKSVGRLASAKRGLVVRKVVAEPISAPAAPTPQAQATPKALPGLGEYPDSGSDHD